MQLLPSLIRTVHQPIGGVSETVPLKLGSIFLHPIQEESQKCLIDKLSNETRIYYVQQ